MNGMLDLFKMLSFSLLLLWFFCGCSQFPDKSVITDLNEKEYQRAIKQDSMWQWFYKHIEFKRDYFINSPEDSLHFKELTYRRYYRYYKYTTSEKWTKIGPAIQNEWEGIYGTTKLMLDSIDTYWKQKSREYFHSNIMNIHLYEIKLIKDIKNGDTIKIKLLFNIEKKQASDIKNVRIRLAFSNSQEIRQIDSGYDNFEPGYFKELNIVLDEVASGKEYHQKEIKADSLLFSKIIKVFKSDSLPIIEVDRINNEPFYHFVTNNSALKLPTSVIIRFRRGAYDEIGYNAIAKEQLDTEYVPKGQYVTQKVINMYKSFDELSYEFSALK